MHQDMSLIIIAFIKLDFMPKRIIQKLDQMVQLATFNKFECLRLSHCLIEYVTEHPKEYGLYASFIDKVLNVLVNKSD